MKWYYISHPYTGNEEENRKKAADVQRHLHEMYADIMCINPLAMFAPLAALSYEKIMTYCLEVMQPADAVIMCRGYEKSRGCMREYEAAKQGKKQFSSMRAAMRRWWISRSMRRGTRCRK